MLLSPVKEGMNPDAMAIINPRKEYWPRRGSNHRPPVKQRWKQSCYS